jgi:starch phosphorylase
MKAGLNGALQVSTSDGWIDEVDWTDTGFILPDEETARALYNLLETKILPLFYTVDAHGLPLSWIQHVRRTQQIVENGFTARRMLYDYLTQSYLVL